MSLTIQVNNQYGKEPNSMRFENKQTKNEIGDEDWRRPIITPNEIGCIRIITSAVVVVVFFLRVDLNPSKKKFTRS